MKKRNNYYFFHKHHKRFTEEDPPQRPQQQHLLLLQNCDNFSFSLVIIFMLFMTNHYFVLSAAGCREQHRDECEKLCLWNGTANKFECNLRAVVILPKKTNVEASLPKVLPVLELAERKIRDLGLLSHGINLKWTSYDDRCDASYATISAMDGYGMDCAHVFFGPSCDYALAPVSRIAKYFRHDGTPLITVGGYTYDFEQNKTTCANEYHMLIRAGLLSFQTIADFMVDVMTEYKWSRAVFFYERNGHYNVAGLHTCYLLMQTMANTYRSHNLTYSSFVTDSAVTNLTESLKREVGLGQSSMGQTLYVFYVYNNIFLVILLLLYF